MRGRLLNFPAIGRAAGFLLVAVAIIAAAVRIEHDRKGPHARPATAAFAADPAARERNRCQDLSLQGQDDAACEAAWAEARRRFFQDDRLAPSVTAPPEPPAHEQGGRP